MPKQAEFHAVAFAVVKFHDGSYFAIGMSNPGLEKRLSPREREIMTLAIEGLTDQGIAHRLGITTPTVNTYWGRIRQKLGSHSRTELAAIYLREEASATVDRLRRENAELVAALERQAATSKMLRASLEMFRGLVATAPDGIVLVDEAGKIQLANEVAERMFGYDADEMLGLTVEQLVPDRYRAGHVGHRLDYGVHPVRKRMGEHLATWALRKDGSEFRMATALSATSVPGGTLVTCIIREMDR